MNQIIPGEPTPKIDQYKVYVQSITYNQSKYIEECLNGVLMQKTDFPFVHQVVDDNSTDGEQEVIKSWIEKNCDLVSAEYYENDLCTITLATAKDNPNYTIAAYFLKKNMYGNPKKGELFAPWREVCPYEALCEGDDYWIDPLKLQKQVDFLDENPDYSLVCGVCNSLVQKDGKIYGTSNNAEKDMTFESMLFDDHIATCTVMFRAYIQRQYLSEITPRWKMGDYPLWLYMSQKGKIHRFADVISVYRVLEKSASHTSSKKAAVDFKLSSIDCSLFFIEQFGLDEDLKRKFYFTSANNLIYRGFSYQSSEFFDAAISFKKEHGLNIRIIDYLLKNLFKSTLFCFGVKIALRTYTYTRKNILHNYHR